MKKNHVHVFIQDHDQYFALGLTAILQIGGLCRYTFLTQKNWYLADLIIAPADPISFFKTYPTTLMKTPRNVVLIQDKVRYRTVPQTLFCSDIIKRHDSINTVLQLLKAAYKKQKESTTADALYRSPALTFRERQVLIAIAQGLPPNRIARQLDIHVKTVSNHKCTAMRKLGFSRNHELYLWLINQDDLPQSLIDAQSLSLPLQSNDNQTTRR